MDIPYYIKETEKKKVPIILSVPHCGTEFPEDLKNNFLPNQLNQLDDTDWFVHQLYDFVSDMGVTMIHAKYSRWVIDLNRDPESVPLYNDGRLITGLCTTTDFFGNPIYKEEKEPNANEVKRRLDTYYWIYYKKIEELIKQRLEEFGKVILWDAHSIRQFVPTIRKEAFPDMILGNDNEKTADKELINSVLKTLRNSKFQINHNVPFKGGHITRYFGNPNKNIHTLQLEMNKILYMDDAERNFNTNRAEEVRKVLKNTFESMIEF